MINTGVSSALNRPQTFHTFTYLYANRSLVSLPMRIAIIGTKTAAGTATAGQVYEVVDATQTDGLFGIGGELALMCRVAFAVSAFLQKGPRVYAVAVAENAGGTANVKTLTVTGTATADGNHIVRVAGRTFTVGVRSGDTQNAVATAISNTMKANAENLPVVVTVATNVVTLTHPTKGVNGTDLATSIDQQVAGSALAFANTATGAGAADHQPAIDALAALKYDGVVFSNHAAADITEINTDIAARWSPTDKGWRWYFLADTVSIASATSLAAAANHQGVIVTSCEGCPNMPGEIATAMAMAAFSRERPNANYNGLRLPLYPPVAATAYIGSEVETAIAAGLTALTPIIDSTGAIIAGQLKIERMVTTKTTTNSQPDARNRDLAVSRTGVYLARQIDVAYEERFGADANPDGTLETDDVIDQVGDTAKAILRAAGEASILRNVEADITKLVLERDSVVSGRVNCDLWYTVVVGLSQVAWKHNVQV